MWFIANSEHTWTRFYGQKWFVFSLFFGLFKTNCSHRHLFYFLLIKRFTGKWWNRLLPNWCCLFSSLSKSVRINRWRGKKTERVKKTTHYLTAQFSFPLFHREKSFSSCGNSSFSMFDQLDCIKVRIDFAIIENQSEMDFFLVLICANKLSFSLRLFLFLRIFLGFFCQCAIAIVHLLIFSAVLILFILKPIEMDIRSLFRTCTYWV